MFWFATRWSHVSPAFGAGLKVRVRQARRVASERLDDILGRNTALRSAVSATAGQENAASGEAWITVCGSGTAQNASEPSCAPNGRATRTMMLRR